jgi:small subunit ribosomal protein S17e
MGRIKTTFVKTITKKLIKQHGEHFTTDFNENKKIADRYAKIESKKIRNIIAGYATRLKKQQD